MIIEHAPYLAKKNILLASQSPRRREILTMLQLPFTVEVSTFEETLPKASFKTAADYAEANACGKAREVASRFPEADLIIGSDTIVVLDGMILEKPKSEADSYSMLKQLSGRSHVVISAVAMFGQGGGIGEPLKCFVETATVTFAELSDDTIQAYIRTGEPKDKAGSCMSCAPFSLAHLISRTVWPCSSLTPPTYPNSSDLECRWNSVYWRVFCKQGMC